MSIFVMRLIFLNCHYNSLLNHKFKIIYKGMLFCTHNVPHPVILSGRSGTPASGRVPRIKYAFNFCPNKNGSFPLTIPHSISNAAEPETNGVANDVPETFSYPPFGTGTEIFTPGAVKSGFTSATPKGTFGLFKRPSS